MTTNDTDMRFLTYLICFTIATFTLFLISRETKLTNIIGMLPTLQFFTTIYNKAN